MRIYTRKGDDGTTGLLYGGRVHKHDAGPAAYGDTDEAVAALGVARAECEPGDGLFELLIDLQRQLFVVGAELATAPANRHKLADGTTRVTASMVESLEPIIDDVTRRFEAPSEFVIPGENRISAALDLARTVVRRAERQAVEATRQGWLEPGSHVVAYLNRLSDLVWTLARWREDGFRPSRAERP